VDVADTVDSLNIVNTMEMYPKSPLVQNIINAMVMYTESPLVQTPYGE
jgi:hypothetical protein